MASHDPTTNSPLPGQPTGGDFWRHRTLAELAAEQGVLPVEDVRVFYGTWPGEPDDGFEALVDEHRHTAASRD